MVGPVTANGGALPERLSAAQLAAVVRTLPNFPEDLIQEWLAPYVLSEGWPPSVDFAGFPIGRWRDLLGQRPLTFWNLVRWTRESLRFRLQQLHGESLRAVLGLAAGYTGKARDPIASRIRDGKKRFDGLVGFISKSGRLPVPPAVLLTPHGLEIMDGYHRIAAFAHVQGERVAVAEMQEFWVARVNNPAVASQGPLSAGSPEG